MAKAKAVEKAAPAGIRPFDELGRTGLVRFGGYIQDDFLPELRDPTRRIKLYREIRDNSGVIGAALLAIEQLLRSASISVESGGEAPEDDKAHELVETSFSDMSVGWQSSMLPQALTMLEYGWAALEIVYKRRQGPDQKDAAKRSQYTDGMIGWRKFAIRSQESLQRWVFDEAGGVQAMEQRPAPNYELITLPIEKLLLFRTKDEKGSPEGRSILRNCVLPWRFVKRIQEIEGIGIERDLAGLPVVYAPTEVLSTTATGDNKSVQDYLKKLVSSIRRDEQEGVLMPGGRDSNGNRLYELTLLSTGGTRQFNTNDVIQRYEQRMAQSLLADFILLGHEKVGSFSLSSDKTDIFAVAISAYLDSILEVMNRFAVPRLLALNGMQAAMPPKFIHGDIDTRPLSEVADYLAKLGGAGFIMPSTDGGLERALLELAQLPVDPAIADPAAFAAMKEEQAAQDQVALDAQMAAKQPAAPSGVKKKDLAKYSEDQPRVPAGSGDPSGEWTAGAGGGGEFYDVHGAVGGDLAKRAARVNHPKTDAEIEENRRVRAEALARLTAAAHTTRNDMIVGEMPRQDELDTMIAATDNMSTYSVALLAENVSGIAMYNSADDMAKVPSGLSRENIARTGAMWVYSSSDPGQVGSLHIRRNADMDLGDVLKHEYGHAIDGHRRFSQRHEWEQVWRAEIREGSDWLVSKQAGRSQHEGFAEYHRALLTQPRSARDAFPQSYALFRQWGLG